jgi:hypothetical protein
MKDDEEIYYDSASSPVLFVAKKVYYDSSRAVTRQEMRQIPDPDPGKNPNYE